MLNNVILLGRLAQDVELKSTQNGTPVVSFDLAVQSMRKDAPPNYIPIVCWDKNAVFADRFLSKGRQIVVEGRIETRKFTDNEGKNRKVVEVVASRIYFADSNSDRGNREGDNGNSDQSEDFVEISADGDLPF